MQHERSAHLSTKRAIEEAEDRGFDAGREYGMELRRQLDIAGLEASGFIEAAAWLREAKVVGEADGEGRT